MGWFSRVQALPSVRTIRRFRNFSLCLCLVSENVYAADLQTILTNVSNVIVPLTAMVLMISYAAGIFMVINALTQMKKFGNMQSATQTQPGEIGGPLLKLIVGAVLIYLPNSTDAFTNSLLGTTASIFGYGSINYQNVGTGASILGYVGGSTLGQQWQALGNTLVLYIQFIGLLSFIKGWFIMSHAAGHGAQPGSLAKGLTHIIGGIIAINFVGIVSIISNTIYGT